MIFEVGYDQSECVIEIIKRSPINIKNVYTEKDYAGINRVIVCEIE